MDAGLPPLAGGLASRGSDPLGPLCLPPAGEALGGLGDAKGALQWLRGPAAGPPAPAGRSLPGDRAAAVSARPREVFTAVSGFFHSAVPAHVEERAEELELSAVAFLDFAATHVKAFVHPGAGPGATLVFRHVSQRDVVRCGQLWAAALDHLLAQRLPVVLPGGSLPRGPRGGLLLDEDFDDDWEELEESDEEAGAGAAGCGAWRERAEAALCAAASASATAREEGLQALAALAARSPGSRPAVAAALAARPALVAALLLEAPVELLYPLAAALELVSAQSGAALAGLAGAIAPALRAGPPPIVERALRTAAERLQPRTARASSKERRGMAILSSDHLPHASTWSGDLVLGAGGSASDLCGPGTTTARRLPPALGRAWAALRADTTGSLPLVF